MTLIKICDFYVIYILILSCLVYSVNCDCNEISNKTFYDKFKLKPSVTFNEINFDIKENNKRGQVTVENCTFTFDKSKISTNNKYEKRLTFPGLTSCKEYQFTLLFINRTSKKTVMVEKKLKTYYKKGALKVSFNESESLNDYSVLWNVPAKDCIGKSMLTVRNFRTNKIILNRNVKGQNSVKFPKLESCEIYSIKLQIMDFNSKVLDEYTKIFKTPGMEKGVIDLISKTIYLDPKVNSVNISWDKIDSNCIDKIELKIFDGSQNITSKKIDSADSTVEILDLSACHPYQLNFTLTYKNKFIEHFVKNFKTQNREPSFVENIVTTINKNIVNITWQSPKHGKFCMSEYLIAFADTDCLTTNNDTISCWENRTVSKTQNYFAEIFGMCRKYKFFVYAQPLNKTLVSEIVISYENYIEKILEIETKNEILMPPTNLRVFQISPSELKLLWTPSGEIQSCKIQQSFEVHVDDEIFSTELDYITISDLIPCRKNYTIKIYAIDKYVRRSEPLIKVINMENYDMILSVVQNLTYEFTGYNISLKWNVANLEEKCTLSYRIRINGDTDYHETKDNKIQLMGMVSCMPYSIDVIPISVNFKEGTVLSIDIQTPAVVYTKPDPPTIVEKSHSSITFFSSFDDPNNNCKATSVSFICYNANNNNSRHVETDEIRKKGFKATIKNLKPFTNYNCTVLFNNKAGWSSKSSYISVTTDEFISSEPTNVKSIQDQENITLYWNEPEIPNGLIKSYQVETFLIATLYDIPNSCNFPDKIIQNYTTEKNFTQTLNYGSMEYGIKVAAVNRAFIGNFSEVMYVQTPARKPSSAKNIKILDFSYLEFGDEYNVSMTFSWNIPCIIHGILDKFYITYTGKRTGFKDHIFTRSFKSDADNISLEYFLTENRFKPEFTYKIYLFIKVLNCEEMSDPAIADFQAPAEIPDYRKFEHFAKVLETFPESAAISLNKTTLKMNEGKIMGIVIMVTEANCQRKLKRGKLTSLKLMAPSWFEVIEMNCTDQYQTTRNHWNPFEMNPDMEFFTYTIGLEDCYPEIYCNGPLKPNTNYSVIVRVFTENGFSDSIPVYFKTRNSLKAEFFIDEKFFFSGLALSAMLIVTILATSAVIIKRRLTERHQPHEEDNNLFTFTNYFIVDGQRASNGFSNPQ